MLIETTAGFTFSTILDKDGSWISVGSFSVITLLEIEARSWESSEVLVTCSGNSLSNEQDINIKVKNNVIKRLVCEIINYRSLLVNLNETRENPVNMNLIDTGSFKSENVFM